jgi:hypothetical protein
MQPVGVELGTEGCVRHPAGSASNWAATRALPLDERQPVGDMTIGAPFRSLSIRSSGCAWHTSRSAPSSARSGQRLALRRADPNAGGRWLPTLDAMQLIEYGDIAVLCTVVAHAGGRSYARARTVADLVTQLGQGV